MMGSMPNERKYQVGDRVQVVFLHTNKNSDLQPGALGTVVGYWNECVAVRWDQFLGDGHRCSGRCEDHHGWNVYESEIDFAFDAVDIDVGAYL